MKMNPGFVAALVTSTVMLAAPAGAATSVVATDCISVTDAAGCLFNGNINSNDTGPNSYLRAEEAYNLFNDTHSSANPDIDLQIIASSDDADFSDFGTFDYDPGSSASGSWNLSGFLVDFIAVKAGSQFVLYQLSDPSSSGVWNTDQLDGKDLSHLVFFGSPNSAVPEPATWAMMIGGFALAGVAMRRARTAVSFA